jgi:hypothetical protein
LERNSPRLWVASFAGQPQGFQSLSVLLEGLLCSLVLCHGFGGIRRFKYLAGFAFGGRNYLPFKCVAHGQLLIPMSVTLRRYRFSATSFSSAPAASTTKPTAYQSQDQQKHDGSYEGVDDQSNDPGPEVNTKARQQPVTYERSDQTNEQITNQSKAATLHHSACQPTGDNSDHDNDEQTLIGEVHDGCLHGGYGSLTLVDDNGSSWAVVDPSLETLRSPSTPSAALVRVAAVCEALSGLLGVT